jgi:hypothetical protein
MTRELRLLLVICLGFLALAGCGRKWFAEREAWRHEAEVACLKSGAVKEGPALVRIDPIQGPGICGADFPLKVAALGESAAISYADELRPPGSIPGGAAAPRWPIREPLDAPPPFLPRNAPPPPYARASAPGAPLPISPPGGAPAGAITGSYDRSLHPVAPAPPAISSPRRASVFDAPARPAARQELEDEDDDVDEAPPSRRPAVKPRPSFERPANVPLRRAPRFTGPIGPVEIKPAATLACPVVSALDQWIGGNVQPAALRWFGQPVVEIKQISAYSCRGMNGNPHAQISEHAFGNALDISAFILADGRILTVKDGWHGQPEEQGFLRDVQGAACEQFTTVLAPGSNRFHYDHFHVDLKRRGSGAVCEPAAVSGEAVAARAAQRYAGRGDVTGSISSRQKAEDKSFAKPKSKWVPLDDDEDDWVKAESRPDSAQ